MNLLFTFDRKSEALVSEAITVSNSEAVVNTLRFPGAVLNQGVTTGFEDEFLNVLRLEGVKDAAKRDAFYSDKQFKVYRVTPSKEFVVDRTDKFDSFNGKMRTRWTGQAEQVQGKLTNEELKSGLELLKSRVVSAHRKLLDYVTVPFKVCTVSQMMLSILIGWVLQSFVNDSGYECLADGSKCQGDCRDTIYAKATLLPQEVMRCICCTCV